MTRIRVEEVVDAPKAEVWSAIEDPANHVEWMAEAVEIRFRTERRSGVGTVMECDTRFGPFTATDVLEFVEWVPGEAMAIRHTGLVTGTGRIALGEAGEGRTRVTWDEVLEFPPSRGGRLGEWAARPFMARVFRNDLRLLKRIIESGWG